MYTVCTCTYVHVCLQIARKLKDIGDGLDAKVHKEIREATEGLLHDTSVFQVPPLVHVPVPGTGTGTGTCHGSVCGLGMYTYTCSSRKWRWSSFHVMWGVFRGAGGAGPVQWTV